MIFLFGDDLNFDSSSSSFYSHSYWQRRKTEMGQISRKSKGQLFNKMKSQKVVSA
jgi:hypothetical protein